MGFVKGHEERHEGEKEFTKDTKSHQRAKSMQILDRFKRAPDHRASQLSVQQRLVLFILSILSIDVS